MGGTIGSREYMAKVFCVYIMTNKRHTVLYTGITSNLARRVQQHKHKIYKGFTTTYNVDTLVYYEVFADSLEAIRREKTIKNTVRRKKEALINQKNPQWKDLFGEIY